MGHGFVIAWNDPYVIDAAGLWLKLWQRRRRALWRGRGPWGVTHPGQAAERERVRREEFFHAVAECLKTNPKISVPAVSSACSAR